MTDRLACPECDGTGETVIGSLHFACGFCQGAGYVGDDNEPAEERPGSDEVIPVWRQVGAETIPGCPTCLGVGQVIYLGDDEPASVIVRVPCPSCSVPGAGGHESA